jgi:predicted regulator of Ras-like GTPase activity (Roadblock/LC7/MglB family)
MFGKIAKFFKRSAGKQSEAPAPALPTAMPAAQALGRPQFAVPGMDVAVETEEPVAAHETSHTYSGGDSIVLPFSTILQLVPKELLGKANAGSVKYHLPKATALEQLARGSVKVPFGDLRRAAPPGLFVISGTTQDSRLVDLPLRDILKQLHPESFARRSSANRLTVPQEVTDLFGSKGERLTEIRVVDKSEIKPAGPVGRQTAAAPVPEPAAEAPAAPIRIVAPNLAQQLQMPSPAPSAPSIPAPGLKVAPKAPAPPAAPTLAKAAVQPPASSPPSMSAVPKLPTSPAPSVSISRPATPTLPPNAIKFPAAPAPVPVPASAAAPAAPASTGGGGTLSVSINTVSQKWPEAIRAVLQQLGVTDLEIPNSLIETSLKLGKIEFQWQQVVSWLRPAPAGDVALDQAGTVLDLPLSVVAPLFLQQSKYKAKQSAVPAGIPDLFSNKGDKLEQEEEEEEETEVAAQVVPQAPRPASPTPRVAAPALSPAAPEVAVPTPAVGAVPAFIPDRRRAQNLSELFGEPNKKNWTPNEIVHKTIGMPGITGALIALQDGLLVAGCMPPPWKTETIAAFIPQIFGRLTQYTKELQMGEVRTVSFGVETGTLQIFNAGIIYFGALGKQGDSLPVEDLTLIASELSRHTK